MLTSQTSIPGILLAAFINLHSFETVDVGGDILEISVTPNRFSDASSHIGIAREAAAAMGVSFKDPVEPLLKFSHKDQGIFRVNIKNNHLCRRPVSGLAEGIIGVLRAPFHK